MHVPQVRKLIKNHRVTMAIGVAFLIIITSIAALFLSQSLPERADKGAVILSSRLITLAEQLQKSLGTIDERRSGKTTENYITILSGIESTCSDFQNYYDKSRQNAPTSDTTVYLTKTSKLCDELVPLANQSRELYQANLPPMQINSTLKKYQTLPIIRPGVRAHDEKVVNQALEPTKRVTEKMEFKTQAVNLLNNLQAAIKASKNLEYYPALANYQRNMLAERQRYWSSYGELGGLTEMLKLQLSKYCQNLPGDESDRMAECR